MNHIIITFIGPDRAGLVDTLSNVIEQHQGNWQTSSLHYLSGFFAGVIEISTGKEHAKALISALEAIPDLNTQIEIAKTANENDTADVVLELTANDRVGIVQEISSVIHQQGGNLLKLVSTQDSAPHSGQKMFKAKAQVSVNENDIDELVSSLENIADDLMVDVSR